MPATPAAAVRYEDLEPTLQTGDLFIFHGTKGISITIERMTGSRFSHAAMVLRPDPAKPPFLWEADPIAMVDDPWGTNPPSGEGVEVPKSHGGAQLGLLRDALMFAGRPEYGDVPYVRRLTANRTPDFEASAIHAIAGLEQRPFPAMKQMLAEWIAGHFHIITTEQTVFCAELVALTYMKMGLLPVDPPPNAYAPKNFSAEYRWLPLVNASLGQELEVLLPAPAVA